MKKILFVLIFSLAITLSGQTLNRGIRLGAGATTVVIASGTGGGGGGGWVADEEFSSELSTATWGISTPISSANGGGVWISDGLMKVQSGGKAAMNLTDFNPQGIFRVIVGNFTAVTKFAFVPTQALHEGGFALQNFNRDKWCFFCKSWYNGNDIIYRRDYFGTGNQNSDYPTFTEENTIYLKLVKSAPTITTFYGSDGSSWTELTQPSPITSVATEPLLLWVGVWNDGYINNATASFDFVHITQP